MPRHRGKIDDQAQTFFNSRIKPQTYYTGDVSLTKDITELKAHTFFEQQATTASYVTYLNIQNFYKTILFHIKNGASNTVTIKIQGSYCYCCHCA